MERRDLTAKGIYDRECFSRRGKGRTVVTRQREGLFRTGEATAVLPSPIPVQLLQILVSDRSDRWPCDFSDVARRQSLHCSYYVSLHTVHTEDDGRRGNVSEDMLA